MKLIEVNKIKKMKNMNKMKKISNIQNIKKNHFLEEFFFESLWVLLPPKELQQQVAQDAALAEQEELERDKRQQTQKEANSKTRQIRFKEFAKT